MFGFSVPMGLSRNSSVYVQGMVQRGGKARQQKFRAIEQVINGAVKK
jgi:hypothetical protein